MGWPEQTDELKHFYPTAVLVTARDIIFFWVARMIFMGLEFMEEKPFHDVLIHGLVLDRDGKKMSKSRPETNIDPLDVIEKYGADTLRFTLATGTALGQDQRLRSEDRRDQEFSNKIWNRPVLSSGTSRLCAGRRGEGQPDLYTRRPAILPFATVTKEAGAMLERYELGAWLTYSMILSGTSSATGISRWRSRY